MAVEQILGYYTRDEWLALLGIPNADDPKLAAIAALSWGGNANKVLAVNGTANGWVLSAITGLTDGDKGDVTVSGGGATFTVDNDVVTNAKAADMAQATIKGRADAAGTGDPTDLTASQVLTILGGTTGTGNLVLAAGPTLTGTLSGANAAFTGTLSCNGNATLGDATGDAHIFNGRILVTAGIRETGTVSLRIENTGASGPPSGSTGQGLEFFQTGMQSFNRTSSAYGGFTIDASSIQLRPSGSTRATCDAQGLTAVGSLKPSSYTVATLPSAATHGAGAMIYVSNETGGAVTAFSDATNWRRVQDRNVVA